MKKSGEKTTKYLEYLNKFVSWSFILPIGFLIYRIATTNNDVINNEISRVRSDYVLMLLQCVVGIVAMAMPNLITKKFKIEIPTKIYYLYVIFLYAAIFLGEIRSFYYRIPYWDMILHTFSGTMLGFFGFSFVFLLNKDETLNMKLSPIFIAIFAFCFSITIGVAWEFYEYFSDMILKTNMQKFALENGNGLIGRLALVDTMEDLIVDTIGAFVACSIGYISLKYKKGWLDNMLFRRMKKNSKKKGE